MPISGVKAEVPRFDLTLSPLRGSLSRLDCLREQAGLQAVSTSHPWDKQEQGSVDVPAEEKRRLLSGSSDSLDPVLCHRLYGLAVAVF